MAYLTTGQNFNQFARDTFTGDGVTTAFTLTYNPGTKNALIVNLNGVTQLTTSYSISGTTLTMSAAPANGVVLEIIFLGVVGHVTTPAAGSVTLSSLATDVTKASTFIGYDASGVPTNAAITQKVSTYQVTDSTDISLAAIYPTTYYNLGSTFSANIPTKGAISIAILEGASAGNGTNDFHMGAGIKIGSTAYFTKSDGVVVPTTVVQGPASATTKVFLGLYGSNVGIGVHALFTTLLPIEGLSIPTGTQTVQLVVTNNNVAGGYLKGATQTTKAYIRIFDHT